MYGEIHLRRVLLLILLLAGCSGLSTHPKPTLPPAAVAEFFEVVESKDYHAMRRKGQETFKVGHYIPDHAETFKNLPSSEVGDDRLRYVLYSFEGEASAGEVYLILEAATGVIVEFNYFEAMLK
jgi:hypothetical protein